MYNDVNRSKVIEFFDNLVKSDQRLTGIKSDLGILSLGYELGYMVDDAVKTIQSRIAEYYSPQSEVILLSKLMYEIGYLRLQKPLIIAADVKSGVDVNIEKYQRFTNGVDVFMLNDDASLTAGIPQTLTLTHGTKREITNSIVGNNMYYKIPLGTTYKKLYDFKAYRGTDELTYSQAFIKEESDVSLEIGIDGNMIAVIRVGNTHGKNVQINDNVTIVLFETVPLDDFADSLAIIGDFDIICENVVKHSLYEQYLTIEQMQDILKHDKNINNSIVYNENYKELIRAHIRGINLLKVWQQEDEDLESGAEACNINKVFVSYIPTEVGLSLDSEIEDIIKETVYGRFVIIREPEIVPITIDIDIINNTKKSIAQVKQEEIKAKLSGYYDDVDRRLSNSKVYREVAALLSEYDVDIDIVVSEKGDFKNARFYYIDIANISISVTER